MLCVKENVCFSLHIDTLEANQLFSYAKELSESEQLDEPEIEMNVNVPCKQKRYVLVAICAYVKVYRIMSCRY